MLFVIRKNGQKMITGKADGNVDQAAMSEKASSRISG